jgi:hypothetical protein
MNYIILKAEGRQEIRLYKEGVDFEGDVIYKGHKLAIESNSLTKILDFRIERYSGKIFFLKYDKITDGVDFLDTKIWIVTNSTNFERNILISWESAQMALELKCGKFRKILITVVNI